MSNRNFTVKLERIHLNKTLCPTGYFVYSEEGERLNTERFTSMSEVEAFLIGYSTGRPEFALIVANDTSKSITANPDHYEIKGLWYGYVTSDRFGFGPYRLRAEQHSNKIIVTINVFEPNQLNPVIGPFSEQREVVLAAKDWFDRFQNVHNYIIELNDNADADSIGDTRWYRTAYGGCGRTSVQEVADWLGGLSFFRGAVRVADRWLEDDFRLEIPSELERLLED